VNESTSDIVSQGRARPAPSSRALDVAEFTGSWVNTESTPVAIARVSIESGGETLRIRTFGSSPYGEGDAQADGLYAASPVGREAVGFTAAYEGPGGEIGLHANISKGLLIVSSFSRHPGGAARPGVFAREFFRRMPESPGRAAAAPGEAEAGLRAVGRPSAEASRPARDTCFHGTWRNTQRNPSLLASLSFSTEDSPLTLRAAGHGARGVSAPESFDAELLTDGPMAPEPSKIRGHCPFGDRDVWFHGWVKQGVLVLAYFVRFPVAGDSSDYFDREFFYREG
jgi:hypothetical protein